MNAIDEFYVNNKNKITIVLLVLLTILFFVLRSCNELNRYKNLHKKNIGLIKKKNELIIEQKQKSIDSLLLKINQKNTIILKANKSIDSIIVLKNRVIVKYKERILEVDDYNSEQVLKYWRDEFSK